MRVCLNTAVFLKEIQNKVSQFACLKTVEDYPIDGIEVRGEFFDQSTIHQELSKINLLCKQNNWAFFFSVPEQLFTAQGLNSNVSKYLLLAEDYGIQSLKFSFGEPDSITAEALQTLDDLFANSDVQLTVENEGTDNGKLETVFSNLLNLSKVDTIKHPSIKSLGYTFDSGNWYWAESNANPSIAFDSLKEFITVLHLKDIVAEEKRSVLLGQGDTDWQHLVKNCSVTVHIFLEYEIDTKDLKTQIELVNACLTMSGAH